MLMRADSVLPGNLLSGRNLFFATFRSKHFYKFKRQVFNPCQRSDAEKYSFITKEYGYSEIPAGGASMYLIKRHTRDDYTTETWMTGVIRILIRVGPVQTIATMQLPLALASCKGNEAFEFQCPGSSISHKEIVAVQASPLALEYFLVSVWKDNRSRPIGFYSLSEQVHQCCLNFGIGKNETG